MIVYSSPGQTILTRIFILGYTHTWLCYRIDIFVIPEAWPQPNSFTWAHVTCCSWYPARLLTATPLSHAVLRPAEKEAGPCSLRCRPGINMAAQLLRRVHIIQVGYCIYYTDVNMWYSTLQSSHARVHAYLIYICLNIGRKLVAQNIHHHH